MGELQGMCNGPTGNLVEIADIKTAKAQLSTVRLTKYCNDYSETSISSGIFIILYSKILRIQKSLNLKNPLMQSQTSGLVRLLLTAAVAAGKYTVDTAYDIPTMAQYMDFINIMSYDLHGSWKSTTGHNSPLFPKSNEYGDQRYLNIIGCYLRFRYTQANKL
ncbi:E3.2.1.14 [Mytilus coruscus]|uniref:E3.2.1.14 n=1 Tax=Mytilus coruscus TaxID=42192 RepID=A0A6J8ATG8_MYTCO|nr:E3.2.1.14 [Mytilus coruscus]